MLDIIIKPSRCLDSNYIAVLNRARSLGYTMPTPAQQHIQSQLMRALKYAGVFNKEDAFWVFANNGSAEFSTINWKTPTAHQVTIVNAVTWARNGGFTGNGTDAYLDTNYNPSTQGVNYVQNDASRWAWVATDGGSFIDGTATNNTQLMNSTSGTSQRINQGTTALAAAVDFSGTGLMSINRTSSTNVEAFKNTTQTSTTATSAAPSSLNQMIFRSNTSYAAHNISAYGLGASLVSEHAGLYNALGTYLACL